MKLVSVVSMDLSTAIRGLNWERPCSCIADLIASRSMVGSGPIGLGYGVLVISVVISDWIDGGGEHATRPLFVLRTFWGGYFDWWYRIVRCVVGAPDLPSYCHRLCLWTECVVVRIGVIVCGSDMFESIC